jgi:uncharacterized protein YkwD
VRRASRTASTIGAALAAPIVVAALVLSGDAKAEGVSGRPDLEPILVTAVNDARSERGLEELQVGSRLGEAAFAHSRDMVVRGYFAHDDGQGTFAARLDRFGVTGSSVGENLGWIYGSATPVQWLIRHWLASRTHRSVLLSPQFDRVGVGVVEGPFRGRPYTLVVTVNFAGA